MGEVIEVFGRLHPVLNHAPIGLLIGLLVIEIVALSIASPLPRRVITGLVWITAISAVLTALSGYARSLDAEFTGSTVVAHMRYGIAVAALSTMLALLHLRAREGTREVALKAYRALLVLTVLLLFPAGHLGGTITHGRGFLTAPLRAHATVEAAEHSLEPTEAGAEPELDYARDVAPILSERCSACHGTERRKGGLSLAAPASILAGGRDGKVLVAGDPEASEIVRRLRLPFEDEEHMPPESKPQPSPAEIEVITKWIAAGAPFGDAAPPPPPEPEPPAPEEEARAEEERAIEALRSALVHVEPIAKRSRLLWIDFAAAATTTGDPEAAALLEPLVDRIADLSLARTQITDATMRLAARMPNLSRLDVRGTAVTDAGIEALAGHPHLVELVLPQTHLTDAAARHLIAIPELRKVYLWNSGVGVLGIRELRLGRPGLAIEAGDPGEARPIEIEPGVELTTFPSAVDEPKDAPKAENAVCPVTGDPVDPRYQIVYRGRTIGFCCPNCPAKFWASPEAFLERQPK